MMGGRRRRRHQRFGDRLNFHPHLRFLVIEEGMAAAGLPLAAIDLPGIPDNVPVHNWFSSPQSRMTSAADTAKSDLHPVPRPFCHRLFGYGRLTGANRSRLLVKNFLISSKIDLPRDTSQI